MIVAMISNPSEPKKEPPDSPGKKKKPMILPERDPKEPPVKDPPRTPNPPVKDPPRPPPKRKKTS